MLDATIKTSGYGSVAVLTDLSLHVGQGELIAVLGANGAGKTTLLRTISGVLVRSDAEIHFDGADMSSTSAYRRVRAGLVHVPEGRHIFGDLTVEENLRMGAYARRRNDDHPASFGEVFELFPVLAERRHQIAAALSGGQQQMLAIGRGLMAQPRLLMVDEASLGLAPVLVEQVFDALTEIRHRGTSVLMVEQNARAALRVADRAYILERGRVALEGTAANLSEDQRIAALYLGGHAGTTPATDT
ncbi:MAG: ABC transporter ATP-binding protein [Actinobacteria bacterium]|nr:ABC transporter ATP-binding protein [Actinomycetota bacterium]